MVSNGNGTPEVLEYLRPWLTLYKVDLKSFDDRQYRKLGGRLEPILDTIRWIHEAGIWLEIVTLVIPGFNDSDPELSRMAEFIAGVSADIPWHVTAYHENYRMRDNGATPAATLERAAALGRQAGLRYVYAGNLPGSVGSLENTCCPTCHTVLVERRGYHIRACRVTNDGSCPDCGAIIPGRWSERGAARPRSLS